MLQCNILDPKYHTPETKHKVDRTNPWQI